MCSSLEYRPRFYVVAKQRNPLILKLIESTGGVLRVDPSLSLESHISLMEEYAGKIDFAICPHEKTIMLGLRDEIQRRGLKIPTTFPTSTFAIERSKILQRRLFPEDYNPRWKPFYPKQYSSQSALEGEVERWVRVLGGAENVVFKPDSPAAGKGVAVGGEHFKSINQLISNYVHNFKAPFIIEEKEDVEESSCQIWYDGDLSHLSMLRYPEVRDYKRAFEGDVGPNTGGMGCYMDGQMFLPYMTVEDWRSGQQLASGLIRNMIRWAEENDYDTDDMWPCMFYLAMAHPHRVFEGNIGRPGDPEDIPPLLTMKNDLVDFYLRLIEGNPKRLEFNGRAVVLVYVVPPTYGGKMSSKPEITVTHPKLTSIVQEAPLYVPGDVELREDGGIYIRSSRSVAVVADGESLEEAAGKAHMAAEALESSSKPRGLIWHRGDIGSATHIERSILHRRKLKGKR